MNSITPVEILKKYWGYDTFRPLQAEIVDSVLSGHDTLGLMPTGGGKSITFQVPAMMLDGVTIVVSPLISLMKDQVDNLKKRRIKAVSFHSGMTARENRVAREKLFNGRAKLLYVSPEKLRNRRFISEIRNLDVSLIVVDEAHCISQWGYDFRPSYLNINKLRHELPGVPLLALTATATPEVAADICRQLEMRSPECFRMSFSRHNLNYIVREAPTKIHEVFHILSRTSGSAIVYVRSRKRTREIAEYLNSAGISATYYHAGLEYTVKETRQNEWQKGNVRVMVATNAFGMGIDKPDVRTVIHFDLPPSLEEYYQEAGRAGRDGLTSYAVLLTSATDPAVLRRRVTMLFPERDYIRKVYERVCNYLNVAVGEGYEKLAEFDLEKFCATFKYDPRQCLAAINLLERSGYIEYVDEPEHRSRIMILLSREELYHLPPVSKEGELVLNKILRTYPGLFADYVSINEETVCNLTSLTFKQVYDAFLELSRMKILHYIPKSRMPYMYFPTSREEPQYVMIGKSVYEDRKKVLSARVEAMIDYGFNPEKCRENRMLLYFGEKAKEDCGRCDVCRSKTKQKGKSEEKTLVEKVMQCLEETERGVDINLIKERVGADGKSLAKVLTFLTDEGFIEYSKGVYRRVEKC